jgi:acyl-CoA thioesterase I
MTIGAGLGHCGAALVLALSGFCFTAAPARAQGGCSAPAEAYGLEHAPQHIRDRVARKLPIKIVAIGSSSTAGFGATSSAATYPSRLEAELKARLPGLPVTVLN